jgi:hypothetical protein
MRALCIPLGFVVCLSGGACSKIVPADSDVSDVAVDASEPVDIVDVGVDRGLPPTCEIVYHMGCVPCDFVPDQSCRDDIVDAAIYCADSPLVRMPNQACLCVHRNVSEACRAVLDNAATCGLRACGR